MKKAIVHVPDKVLTTPAKPVTSFDGRRTKLVGQMKTTLLSTRNPKGVGLAAVQIGEPWRVFITKPWDKSEIRVFVNPEIVSRSKKETDGVPERDNRFEGCLSIPKIWGVVHRARMVKLRFQDETGKTHEESFTGFLATIIQHETDHTNGILYTQRVLEQKEKLYQSTKDKDDKEVLEEIPLT